jgi:hypothetical protein
VERRLKAEVLHSSRSKKPIELEVELELAITCFEMNQMTA